MLNVKSIVITPDLLDLLSELDEFKGRWNALQNHTTALNLLSDVASFGKNFTALFEPLKHADLDADILFKLMPIITKAPQTGFKQSHMPLVIQKGEELIGTLDTAAPEEVEAFITPLMSWIDDALDNRRPHPLIAIALFTVIFLQISPFEKGNQRLSRLLITLLMFRAGYAYAPYVSLEEILFADAHHYFETLKAVQDGIENGKPDWGPWLVFFLGRLKAQKDVLSARMKKSEKDLSGLPRLSAKIMALFKDHKELQMKEIERLTRGRRSTLKLRLGELVDQGYLKRHGKARSTWYSKV